MGSVEAFPRKPGVATIADVWRIAPLPAADDALRVRAMRIDDCAAIRALQRQASPGVPPWTLQQLESQRHIFPEGQLVAEAGGLLVGAVSTLVVKWDDYTVDHTWRSITGDGHFTTHDPAGRTLYAAEVVVDVSRRGLGVGRTLYQAQRRLCRRLNLRRVIAAARLPGYREVRDTMSPELYAMKVIWGDLADPVLRLPMTQGFHYCGVIHDYLPEDHQSCGHAALTVWLNPLYSPPRPPAAIESQRQRKVA
jgi:ribosomal protein S18 acetylase RimI-like enzyme